ncbi:MAG: hypothetical protein QNJ48_08300 [Desulfobacterales bacterium]|nr:hypothetical protein [Desulfobacterales bacterium]MDJ0873933.1 hypothetical protein [Desulfobacterales bacterium]MDJ0884149.1 hypothetical protein [Desulfobacterales bacterium]
MPDDSRHTILEDELIMIRSSGEIPEVALHNAVHYLTRDAEGPGLTLRPGEIRRLQEAVLQRYQRIILRDLNARLRDKPVYRGIERSIINWGRLCRFAAREKFALQALKTEIATALGAFLEQEVVDVAAGRRATCVNCNLERLQTFSAAVGYDLRRLPVGWHRYLKLA